MLVSKQVARCLDKGVVSKHPLLMEHGSSQSRNTVRVFSASETIFSDAENKLVVIV